MNDTRFVLSQHVYTYSVHSLRFLSVTCRVWLIWHDLPVLANKMVA